MAYKKMKLKNGEKTKETPLKEKIARARADGSLKKYLYNESDPGEVKKKTPKVPPKKKKTPY